MSIIYPEFMYKIEEKFQFGPKFGFLTKKSIFDENFSYFSYRGLHNEHL